MSSTLTWKNTAAAAKTNTTNSALITDMKTAVDSLSGDASFTWQSASSSTAGPLYLVLKPKDGSAGRLLFVIWASAPAGNNAAILQTSPTTNTLYCAWFPAGNVDSPSNLTASSGTILGDDTGAVKVSTGLSVSTIYAASWTTAAFASGTGGDGGVLFTFNDPSSATFSIMGGGKLVVDTTDTARDCVLAGNSFNAFQSSGVWAWTAASTTINAGITTSPCIRTNYPSTDKLYFQMHIVQSTTLINQTIGSSDDIWRDTSNSKVYFFPILLAGRGKGEGGLLKLRQWGIGPKTVSAFETYNTTGPVLGAVSMIPSTAGGASGPWLVNTKV